MDIGSGVVGVSLTFVLPKRVHVPYLQCIFLKDKNKWIAATDSIDIYSPFNNFFAMELSCFNTSSLHTFNFS